MIKTREFVHDGITYEVRATPQSDSWLVQVFRDSKPASPITYSVSYETAMDAELSWVADLVSGLMETAEDDVRRGLLEQLAEAEKEG